jgi:hypothetical protein
LLHGSRTSFRESALTSYRWSVIPHKFNADRRDKFPKAKYAVINWPEYNDALRARGDLTVWFDEGAAG